MNLPHNLRIIPRIVFIFAIIGALVLVLIGMIQQPRQEGVTTTTSEETLDERLARVEQLISTNEYDTARSELHEILVFWPTNTYALTLLTRLSVDKNQIWEEINRVRQIVAVQPDYKAAWETLANLYERVEEEDLARDAREKTQSLKAS